METLRNIDVTLVSLKINFENIPHLFLRISLLNLGKCFRCIYQEILKYRQVKITKHASTGTNYAILTKWVKVQHENKFVLKYGECLPTAFEQTSTKFIEIFVL